MKRVIGMIGIVSVLALLSGCQQLNNDLSEINNGLSHVTGQKTTSTTASTASKKTH